MVYALVNTSGTVVNTIEWDGSSAFGLPESTTAVYAPDGAAPGWSWTKVDGFIQPPPPPVPPPLTVISAIAFFRRFTDREQVAVQTAVNANPQLGVGLVNGLAAGQVDLLDTVVKQWTDGLVASGAITADRQKVILSP